MPVNSLTTNISARFGTIVLETLVQHYFDRLKRDTRNSKNLKDDEILYHEAFNIVKAFMNTASHHTVEEVQGFSNTPTPSSPWTHVVRVVVPRQCCDKAADHLIHALGGEDHCRKTVGGTKWWQVRGIDGVDGQWITAKKDWNQYIRRAREKEKNKSAPKPPEKNAQNITEEEDSGEYEREMDDMRCILYAHGGGYYFGSVDQERYSIQRHARKINGRVFAINYRLAPQYPFPCALQDLLAAYLYLIDPPPGSSHKPVNPAQIVVAGDSAGGGLTLALLQVLRDTPGVPLPAGGILISPWCDLTHSFPSILSNTTTDIIPAHGLCIQKPSTLWPPPSEDVASRVHTSLRSRLRQALKLDDPTYDPTVTIVSEKVTPPPIDTGSPTTPTATIPIPMAPSERIELETQNGENLVIESQVQMYTENNLIGHPLVSAASAYMGGLPPLFFIASDGEVLRDEILYVAHRAAYPERFPINAVARNLYPSLKDIALRHPSPTKVHLQVYDDSAHVLPVLFLFTTPAKFCYRAMASFCKHVMVDSDEIPPLRSPTSFGNFKPLKERTGINRRFSFSSSPVIEGTSGTGDHKGGTTPPTMKSSFQPRGSSIRSIRRSVSVLVNRTGSKGRKPKRSVSMSPSDPNVILDGDLLDSPTLASQNESDATDDVAGPRCMSSSPEPILMKDKYAGEPSVYENPWEDSPMIRERVSTQGIIRCLEAESELGAFQVPEDQICQLNEPAVRRYIDAKAKFDKKYEHILIKIEKERRQHLMRAKTDSIKQFSAIRSSLMTERGGQTGDTSTSSTSSAEKVAHSNGGLDAGPCAAKGGPDSVYWKNWSLAWVLDDDERPPPSSIVARRDTHEARQLAMIADQSMFRTDNTMSANNLWTTLVNLLSNPPEKALKSPTAHHSKQSESPGKRTKFSRFLLGAKASSISLKDTDGA